MKRFLIIAFLGLLCLPSYSQKFEVGANAIAGYTALDIESVVGMELTDWDQFSYGGNILALYLMKENFSLGLEAGYHRLYYWEYTFNLGYGTQWRWGDESTILFGPVIELKKSNFFAQSGVNARIFTDNSGIVAALMFGGGYEIKFSKNIGLPIGLRSDIIFGSGTPVVFSLSLGIRYKK